MTPFDGNGLQPPEARSFLCGFNCFGVGLTKESGLCFFLCLLAEWFVPAGALKSYLLNSPLFLRLECRHGVFSLFPVSVCLTLSALLWFNTACFEKPSVNDSDRPADSPVTEACDCPEQSSRDTRVDEGRRARIPRCQTSRPAQPWLFIAPLSAKS